MIFVALDQEALHSALSMTRRVTFSVTNSVTLSMTIPGQRIKWHHDKFFISFLIHYLPIIQLYLWKQFQVSEDVIKYATHRINLTHAVTATELSWSLLHSQYFFRCARRTPRFLASENSLFCWQQPATCSLPHTHKIDFMPPLSFSLYPF